nr:MAG TPA: hypothetical protein [Caudoviricetes sp.]
MVIAFRVKPIASATCLAVKFFELRSSLIFCPNVFIKKIYHKTCANS